MQRGIAAGLLGLLERRTAFLHCRLYLIGAMMLAALIPALSIPVWTGETLYMAADPGAAAAPTAADAGTPSLPVAVTLFLYALGVREKNITLIRVASVFGVLGIVVNRFNVCLVAFNWQLDSADRYFPSISEVFLSIFIVTLIVTAYRFVCSKMPVLYEHPDFKDAH